MKLKKILAGLTCLALLAAPGAAFADSNNVSLVVNKSLAIPMSASEARENVDSRELAEVSLLEMKAELRDNGFTQNDLTKMSGEIPELYEIITNNDLDKQQLENLKDTFANIHKVDDGEETLYPVDENGIVDMGDHKTIVPHPEYYIGKTSQNNVSTQAARAASSGVHMMTYSDPSYKFFKSTGYVDLPSVRVKYNPGAANEYNSRPYIMYGAYGNGGGFDAGLVYYEETQSWRLFRNVLGNGWAEKNISLSGDEAYLWMELNGGQSLIKVIDPNSWKEVASLTIPAPSSFTTRPSNVNITREVALAQFNRVDNGDYLKNAHWNNVYYYKADGFNTPAKAQYVVGNIFGRYPYDSSMPKYLIGDTLADKSKVTIHPDSNYSAEWVNIVLN